jgi:putative transposase
MPWGLKRYQQSRRSHFVTFSCYRRLPYLTERLRDIFLSSLERTRTNYRLRVYGYVVMPEHVHLLVSEPDVEMLSKSIQALKISVARLAAPVSPFWQKPYYDPQRARL